MAYFLWGFFAGALVGVPCGVLLMVWAARGENS